MIDEIFEWLYVRRAHIYRHVPFEFLDPRNASIRTEEGREARRSFQNLYEGERRVSWPCFVEFMQNAGRVRGPDKLVAEWARWVVEYESSRSPSELLRNHMRELFMSQSGPCDGNMMDPDFGCWFDFGGYLLFRNRRPRTSGSAMDRDVGAELLSALNRSPRNASDRNDDGDQI